MIVENQVLVGCIVYMISVLVNDYFYVGPLFYLLDCVTPTEKFQISDWKKIKNWHEEKLLHTVLLHWLVAFVTSYF